MGRILQVTMLVGALIAGLGVAAGSPFVPAEAAEGAPAACRPTVNKKIGGDGWFPHSVVGGLTQFIDTGGDGRVRNRVIDPSGSEVYEGPVQLGLHVAGSLYFGYGLSGEVLLDVSTDQVTPIPQPEKNWAQAPAVLGERIVMVSADDVGTLEVFDLDGQRLATHTGFGKTSAHRFAAEFDGRMFVRGKDGKHVGIFDRQGDHVGDLQLRDGQRVDEVIATSAGVWTAFSNGPVALYDADGQEQAWYPVASDLLAESSAEFHVGTAGQRRFVAPLDEAVVGVGFGVGTDTLYVFGPREVTTKTLSGSASDRQGSHDFWSVGDFVHAWVAPDDGPNAVVGFDSSGDRADSHPMSRDPYRAEVSDTFAAIVPSQPQPGEYLNVVTAGGEVAHVLGVAVEGGPSNNDWALVGDRLVANGTVFSDDMATRAAHHVMWDLSTCEGSGTFADEDGSAFEHDIEWLYASGITTGCRAEKFCPGRSVTRGEMATFLDRALDLPPAPDHPGFADSADSVHADSIRRLVAAGITSGCSEDRYCPNAPVQRDEMAAFLQRGLDLPIPDGQPFADADSSQFGPEIAAVADANITRGCRTEGEDRYFCPQDHVPRSQMAAFLHRAFGE